MDPIPFIVENPDTNIHQVPIFDDLLAQFLRIELNPDLEIFLFIEFLVDETCKFIFFLRRTDTTKIRK